MDFRPLAGLRVVEMTHMIMGPSCGMFLGFLGAEVIKVEPPEGDKSRNLTGMGRSFWPLFNRGKKSVQLDLKAPAGRDALMRLLKSADVFVENFRDESARRAGTDPETLRRRFPKLIIGSHKGFLRGPYQGRAAMDEVVQMMTGLAYMTGPSGQPLRAGSSVNDILGGLFGAFSIVAALMERKETERGREIRVGLFESCLMLVAQHMVQFELEGENPPPMPERTFSWPVYDIFSTADAHQLFIGAVTEGQWAALCAILGLDDLKDDPRLQSKMDMIRARDWTIPRVSQAVADRRKDDLVSAFEAAGIPFSPILKPCDMYEDEHVTRPGGLTESHLPDGTPFRAPALPFEVDGAIMSGGGDLAGLGDDTRSILAALSMSDEEIAAAQGI